MGPAIPSKPHQQGFRRGHSKTTALANITELVKRGMNLAKPPNRTILVALDLKAAFDTVDHAQLQQQINGCSL